MYKNELFSNYSNFFNCIKLIRYYYCKNNSVYKKKNDFVIFIARCPDIYLYNEITENSNFKHLILVNIN